MQNGIIFSQKQWSIINGSLLGDGHLTCPKYGNSAFVKNQAADRRDYLAWHQQELEGWRSSLRDYTNKIKKKVYYRSCLRVNASPLFSQLRCKWYIDNIKSVPKDLQLDPLTVAVWFFDDGSNDLEDRSCKFASYCFGRNDCEYLAGQLEKLNILTSISADNVIRVRSCSYKNFIDLISPFMLWNCFDYKIVYRDSKTTFISDQNALEMIELYHSGVKQQEIASRFQTTASSVSGILRGQRKKHLGQKAKLALNNKSGYRGVSWDKGRKKWMACVKKVNLGRFDTKEAAIAAVEDFLCTV